MREGYRHLSLRGRIGAFSKTQSEFCSFRLVLSCGINKKGQSSRKAEALPEHGGEKAKFGYRAPLRLPGNFMLSCLGYDVKLETLDKMKSFLDREPGHGLTVFARATPTPRKTNGTRR